MTGIDFGCSTLNVSMILLSTCRHDVISYSRKCPRKFCSHVSISVAKLPTLGYTSSVRQIISVEGHRKIDAGGRDPSESEDKY